MRIKKISYFFFFPWAKHTIKNYKIVKLLLYVDLEFFSFVQIQILFEKKFSKTIFFKNIKTILNYFQKPNFV